MNILILIRHPYPYGMAATNRIHMYACGINEIGGSAKVFVLHPTETDTGVFGNREVGGMHEGVPFEYVVGTTLWSTERIVRKYQTIKGLVLGGWKVFRERRKIDAIFLYSAKLPTVLLFRLLSNICKTVYITERTEIPFFQRTGWVLRTYAWLHSRIVYRFFDGVVVISEPLERFFQNKVNRNAGVLTVPILVNRNQFHRVGGIKRTRTVVYCGDLSLRKDGLPTLIEAFARVAQDYAGLKLVVVGDTQVKRDKDRMWALVRELGLIQRVVFTGYVSKKELIKRLCEATVLVLPKPAGYQAEFCMPSKLAEYLATGNPVIVSKSPEVCRYLNDEENAFLVEPDDPEELAKKMSQVLGNLGFADGIGKKGAKLAAESFDHVKNAERLVDFVASIRSSCRSRREDATGLSQRTSPDRL